MVLPERELSERRLIYVRHPHVTTLRSRHLITRANL